MIMPSIVRAVRSLLRPSALRAIRNTMKIVIADSLNGGFDGRRRQRRQLMVRQTPLGDWLVCDDEAIAERHDARAVLGDIDLVRDEHHGDAPFTVEALKD